MDSSKTEDAYWVLIQSTQRESYSGFVHTLRSQDENQQTSGNVAVFESAGESKNAHREFTSSAELRTFLDNNPIKPDAGRVIVLEGLPRSFVEVLGSRLKIPPSFFGDHWENPEQHFMRRTLRHRDPSHRYMLKWRNIHRSNVESKNGDPGTYLMSSNVARTVSSVSLFGECDGMTTSGAKLSFWRVTLDKESWAGEFLSTY